MPETIRNPIGLARRNVADLLIRLGDSRPIPPRSLLEQIQLTPWAHEYLAVGRRSARAIREALSSGGLHPGSPASILDFGCGSGRTLRHLGGSGWTLTGCDIDQAAIDWCSRAIPFARFLTSPSSPPFPSPDESFDAVYAVSVFTHFDEAEQLVWRDELHRLLRPGGLGVISVMGADVMSYFGRATSRKRERLLQDGFLFMPGEEAFNSRSAFHTPAGIVRLFGPRFALALYSERGLDGFQDLVLLRRR
ncbi:MAG TPA: class I SAM-dependent methyltransferase [Thermoanaerobaculia bacterium]|nr:class I SAM-dependent methyltransferase [Thermoanaerobaculia bacterium]